MWKFNQKVNGFKTRVIILAEIGPGVRVQIIFDSGANHHVFKNFWRFNNVRKTDNAEIKTADGNLINTNTVGDVLWLSNVYYAPNLEFNVISISHLDNQGYYVLSLKIKC